MSNEKNCRQAFDDFYHKIKAEVSYDHWCSIWRFISKRQARGEPVAYGLLAANTGRMFQLELAEDYEDAGLGQMRPEHVVPLYTAPQPQRQDGEPVARVNEDGFIVETGLGLAPGTLLYTAPQQARGEPVMPRHVKLALEENIWRNALIGLCDTDRIDKPEQAIKNVKARMRRMGFPQPPQIPEGYALVPIEPTEEMMRAGCQVPLNKAARHNIVYKAMLEAAPPPVEAGDQTGQKMPAIRMNTGSGGGDQDGGAA